MTKAAVALGCLSIIKPIHTTSHNKVDNSMTVELVVLIIRASLALPVFP